MNEATAAVPMPVLPLIYLRSTGAARSITLQRRQFAIHHIWVFGDPGCPQHRAETDEVRA
jgi:hypothetical protein